MAGVLGKFESKPIGKQIVILALIFDPLGAALGYLLHPQLGVEPIIGVVIGLVAASTIHGLWVARNAT